MSSSCYLIYVQTPDGKGGHYPEVLSSVAETEELARIICKEWEMRGYLTRWQWVMYWGKETTEFWIQQLCDTQR